MGDEQSGYYKVYDCTPPPSYQPPRQISELNEEPNGDVVRQRLPLAYACVTENYSCSHRVTVPYRTIRYDAIVSSLCPKEIGTIESNVAYSPGVNVTLRRYLKKELFFFSFVHFQNAKNLNLLAPLIKI